MTELAKYKITQLEKLVNKKPATDKLIFVYIITPKIENFQKIEEQIKTKQVVKGKDKEKEKEREKEKEYHVIVIPHIDSNCYDYLQNSDVSYLMFIHNVYVDVYPLDYDLLSMEEYHSLYDIYINKNTKVIGKMIKVVIKIENMFGKIKKYYYKGNYAKLLYEAIKNEENSTNIEYDDSNQNDIHSCIILDRNVDLISVLCSQYNYEGLLDEYFNIKLNKMKVNKVEQLDDRAYDFNHNNFYYAIKNYHFSHILNFLPNRLKQHEKITNIVKGIKEISEVNKYISLYKNSKEEREDLTDHINLANYIINISNLKR